MSAFGGNTLQFGLRIGATDDTRGGLRSALASVQGFMRSAVKPIQIPISIARGGLGLLRDINMGLAPLVRGLDAIIERGSSVEVQQKTFRALTQASARDADRLAASVVKASSGTLSMARGMQIANRALASGMNLDQIRTAVEFISKFSVAIGKEPGEALNTVITGLARGSTLFLDDFGILVDGVEKVKQDFDSIKGAGAFDSLGPAAQKAEIVRQAIAEMEQRTRSLGISGRETVFVWQSLKNTVSDGVDQLVLTISKSGALKSAISGVRDALSGVNEHFKKGGTFAELFFGKGDSGGLLGLAKGALVDAGSALGRGILGSLLVGVEKLAGAGRAAWGWFKSEWPAIWAGFKTAALESWAGFKVAATEAFDEVVSTLTHFPQAFMDVYGPFLSQLGDVLTSGADRIAAVFRAVIDWATKHVPGVTKPSDGGPAVLPSPDSMKNPLAGWLQNTSLLAGNIREFFYTRITPEEYEAKRQQQLDARRKWEASRYQPLHPGLLLRQALASAGVGSTDNQTNYFTQFWKGVAGSMPSFFDRIGNAGRRVLSGGVLGGDSAFLNEAKAFRAAFPGMYNEPGYEPTAQPMGRFRLTQGARDSRMNRLRVMEAQLRNIESGGDFARQNALRESGEQIRGLLRQGYHVGPGDRRAIFEQALERQIASRRSAVQGEIDRIRAEVGASDERRRFEAEHTRMTNASRQSGVADAEVAAAVRAIGMKIDQFVGGVSAVVQKLTGVEITLANAQGRAA